MSNVTLFSQIIHKIDRTLFNKLVLEKQTDKGCKGFNSWTHLVSMLFCHFAKSTSVRDISNGLRSATGNLNHLRVNRAPPKSSISYQNERRDADLFKELYYGLLNRLGQQANQKRVKLRIKVPVYLLDATVISLCLSVFDWATFRRSKGAVKMPAYVNITEGSVGDNKGAYEIPLQKGAVIVADRYYNDFPILNIWDSKEVYFVIRHKHNLAPQSYRKRAS